MFVGNTELKWIQEGAKEQNVSERLEMFKMNYKRSQIMSLSLCACMNSELEDINLQIYPKIDRTYIYINKLHFSLSMYNYGQ